MKLLRARKQASIGGHKSSHVAHLLLASLPHFGPNSIVMACEGSPGGLRWGGGCLFRLEGKCVDGQGVTLVLYCVSPSIHALTWY